MSHRSTHAVVFVAPEGEHTVMSTELNEDDAEKARKEFRSILPGTYRIVPIGDLPNPYDFWPPRSRWTR